jgi:hypothetical protein
VSEPSSEKDNLKIVVRVVLWLGLAIVVLLIIKIFLPSLEEPSKNPNETSTPTVVKIITPSSITPTDTDPPTPTSTGTAYKEVSPTSTTSPFPAPELEPTIINGPLLFRVEGWSSDDEVCKPEVTIFGVTISHATPPYVFTFWSQEKPFKPHNPVINQVIHLENSRDYIEFTPPIVIVRDKYKHVEFSFHREDGILVLWIKDLFYLSCN